MNGNHHQLRVPSPLSSIEGETGVTQVQKKRASGREKTVPASLCYIVREFPFCPFVRSVILCTLMPRCLDGAGEFRGCVCVFVHIPKRLMCQNRVKEAFPRLQCSEAPPLTRSIITIKIKC